MIDIINVGEQQFIERDCGLNLKQRFNHMIELKRVDCSIVDLRKHVTAKLCCTGFTLWTSIASFYDFLCAILSHTAAPSVVRLHQQLVAEIKEPTISFDGNYILYLASPMWQIIGHGHQHHQSDLPRRSQGHRAH